MSSDDRFTIERIYIKSTVELRFALEVLSKVKTAGKIETRNAWALKEGGAIAHEYLVFPVYYPGASEPLFYIRIDRHGVPPQPGEATSKATADANATHTEVPLVNSASGDLDGVPQPEVPLLRPPAPKRSVGSSSLSSSDSLYNLVPIRNGEDRFTMNTQLEPLLHSKLSNADKYELEMTFAQPVDPMKFLVLASTVKDVAPEYRLHSLNCYFFSKMVVHLARDVLGAKLAEAGDNKLGKGFGFVPMPFLFDDRFKDCLDSAKGKFAEKWAWFEREVSLSL